MQVSALPTNNIILSDLQADLNNCPTIDAAHSTISNRQLTIGDLHGNAIKFIYFLIRQQVLTITQTDYEQLLRIYKIPVAELTAHDLKQFNTILAAAPVNPVGTIRLIGDELSDRGSNDYFTLKILEKLSIAKVAVEVMLSNHSIEFIEAFEKKAKFHPPRLKEEHAYSLIGLQQLIDLRLINRSEVLTIVDRHYKPCLRAINCTLNADKTIITIYSHAGIGLDTIQHTANKLNVVYQDATAEQLATTIHNINRALTKYIQNNSIHTLYTAAGMQKGYWKEPIDQAADSFAFIMWNRSHDQLKRPKKQHSYALYFVHGHDFHENTHENIINLNNTLGISLNDFKRKYHILLTHNLPAPRLKFSRLSQIRMHFLHLKSRYYAAADTHIHFVQPALLGFIFTLCKIILHLHNMTALACIGIAQLAPRLRGHTHHNKKADPPPNTPRGTAHIASQLDCSVPILRPTSNPEHTEITGRHGVTGPSLSSSVYATNEAAASPRYS